MNKKNEIFAVPKNEVIDTGPSEIVEKFLDVSEVENEKQHSLVRIDINVIEYPLFTKNPRRKKNQIIRYFFNRDKEAYIQVNPTSGDFIPGEFEERVFIAILKIMRDKKYNNEFYTKPSEILYNMGIPQTSYKSFYKKITLALQRLSQTSYTFKNSLYSNKMKGIIDDKINTNIMNIRIITLNQAEKDEMEYFQDKRTKEVIKISISNYFYDNIIRKGYLVYDSQLLLNMDSPITRALYMLVNKLRFNKFHLRVLALSLIKKIPLSDDAKSLGRSIKSLEKSCKQLKEMDLISDYNVIKQGKLVQTEIEFFFEEKHNAIKQSFFYDDKNHFDNLLITYTDKGEEGEIITESEEALKEIQHERENITPTEEKINIIFEKLPPRAKELKTMPGTIKDAIRQYGFEYVKYTAEYMSKNKVTKIRSYFIQALEKGWAENFMTIEKSKSQKKKEQQLTFNTIEMQNTEKDKADEEIKSRKTELYNTYYKNLSEAEQEEVTKKVFDDYIKMSGTAVAGPAQKIAFQRAKESLIKEYLYKTDAEKIKDKKSTPEKEMKEIHMGTLIFGEDFNKEKENEISGSSVEDIYKDIEDITFTEEKEEGTSEKKIKKSDIICDIKKVYNEISLFQMELLDFLELLDTIEQETQDKIVRIVGISKHFEATVGGYYMKIEYVKDKESSIKIIKK
ncbi:hypothetical protein I6E17_02605 [Fusobacterium perfoetens]|uniref:hypothetical protein n=1 Tax=Fusobacterium perfoetens TaxID=852 RepID=UPI001F1E3A86|nr:hypothetical protein [Fusobacterium perfoetens]MCF2625067.1 hypothetical protein [Fusobacterium perfoetens]